MSAKKFAVLGCGPAGLLSAYAIELLGHEVEIFSVKAKSPIPGAQYLHDPIPGLCGVQADGRLNYVRRGQPEGYAQKVYGDPNMPTSWHVFHDGYHPAWSMRDVYDQLWERYEGEIQEIGHIRGKALSEMLKGGHQAVFCSIPANTLCMAEHGFKAANVWIRMYEESPSWLTENTILYSGDPLDAWYRSSNIFGHASSEFSHKPAAVMTSLESTIVPGIKPTANDCNCWNHAAGLVRIGRFGKWQKGVLVHQAFRETMAYVEARWPRERVAHALL